MVDDPEVELAAVKEQLKAIQQSVEEIKVAVTQLVVIDRTVAEMKVRQQGHEEKIKDALKRVDELEIRHANNTAYLNRLRGGFSLTVTLVTLIQAAVLAGASWLLTTVIDARQDISVMQQNLHQLEIEHTRVMESLLAERRK
ncbi:MAG: hypothetical protein ACI4SV_00225 [Duodenibacillus sp.]